MSADSFLKQYSEARVALVQSALTRAVAIIVGRRRVLSGIRWRDDLIVTAAEAIGGAEHVDIRLEGDELGAEVVATDLTTDVAVLRVDTQASGSTVQATGGLSGSAMQATGGLSGSAMQATGGPSADARQTNGRARGDAKQASSAGAQPGAADAGTHSGIYPSGTRSSGTAAPASGSSVSRSSSAEPQSATASTETHSGEPSPTPLLRVGEAIVAVGRTLRGPMAMWGSVQLAGAGWNSRRGGRIDQRLELDLAFNPSLEGGAVVDMGGNLAAMLVPGPYHRILGIPTTTIEAVVAKVSQFGHLPKPYIGIRLQPLWLDDDTRTKLGRKSRGIAAVGGVDAGSPAADAQIELGDLLLTVDGEPAESVNGLAQRIATINPGQTITLEVLRGGKPLTINVQVGERPHH